jgi:hypothetical protein
MIRKFKCGILSVAASVLVFAAVAAAQYESPEMKAGQVRVQSALIVPPVVVLEKSGFKSSEPMLEASRNIEGELSADVGQVLREHGYNVVAGPFTTDALDADNDLKYALGDLQKQFDSLNILMQKKPKDVRKDRFTMGDAVNKISSGGAADVLVFTRGNGRQITGGLLTAEIIGGFGPSPYFHLQIAVVDAHTGSVLFYGKNNVGNNFPGAVRWIFKDFPARSQ